MPGRERGILIHSFSEQDGVLAGKVLGGMGIETSLCRNATELFDQLERGERE